MQSLYYLPISSSLTFISDNNESTSFAIDNLIVCGSIGEIMAFSGSALVISFPIAGTNIYYNPLPSQASPYPIPPEASPTQSSFLASYTFTPDIIFASTSSKFIISSGSTIYVSQSQYYGDGGLSLDLNKNYLVTVSGSGDFYDLSLAIINTTTLTTSSYITSSNSYISASISSSKLESYSIIATADTLPGLKASFSSSASIPVTPTSSLSAWNNYLNVSASRISSSGNTFWVVGDSLYNTSAIIITGSGLNDYYDFGMNYIVSYSLYNNKLSSFPNVFTSSTNLTYFNISNNLISGTINLSSNNKYLKTFIASNNKLSGSIPALSGSYSLQYFDVNNNYLTGNIDLSRCYNMQHFDVSNNQLSGSILDITSSCGNLQYFNYSNNYISGSIPSLSSSFFPNLTDFICTNNGYYQSYDFTTDVFSPTLLNFQAFNANLIKADTIENILYALDAGGGISGSVNLSGSTNASLAPVPGYTYTASLKSKGWTVYVN